MSRSVECTAKRETNLEMNSEEAEPTHFIKKNLCNNILSVPSVLLRCWLGDRKSIRPVKGHLACKRAFGL